MDCSRDFKNLSRDLKWDIGPLSLFYRFKFSPIRNTSIFDCFGENEFENLVTNNFADLHWNPLWPKHQFFKKQFWGTLENLATFFGVLNRSWKWLYRDGFIFNREISNFIFFRILFVWCSTQSFFQKNEKYCQLLIYKIYERWASEREFFSLVESGKVGCLQNVKTHSEDISSNANLEKETKGTLGLVTEIAS